MDATVILTPEERADLQGKFRRAQDRMRDTIVFTWLMQGVSAEKMASLIEIPVEQVTKHFEDAREELRSRMQEIPEGPFLLAQIVCEGYHRVGTIVMRAAQERLEKLMLQADPDESAIQGYLKTMLDTQDRMLKTQARLGFVELADAKGSGRSQGGARTRGALPSDPVAEWMASLTEEEKHKLEEGAKRFEANAVEAHAEVLE